MLRIRTNGTELAVSRTGSGPPLLLVHGWPHTHAVWDLVAPDLAATHEVLALDLRGIGASRREASGYDPDSIADDFEGLLTALHLETVDVMAIDASVPAAFLLAMRGRVGRLVVMESTLGALPGAEHFFASGLPWWFGFHQSDIGAETIIAGHEAEYIDWFLKLGTASGRGIPGPQRDAFVAAYADSESLRCSFEYYRAMPLAHKQIRSAIDARRLECPVLAIGSRPVGDALQRQLSSVTTTLSSHIIEDCGHIIPLDRPRALLDVVLPFLTPPHN